jgi:hypothetical protein
LCKDAGHKIAVIGDRRETLGEEAHFMESMARTAADLDSGRESALEHYRTVRDRTEALAAPLSPEDQTVQSMADVSPTKWHRAHTTWFFENFILAPFVSEYRAYDHAYGYLFNSYYEGAGPRGPASTRSRAIASISTKRCERSSPLPRLQRGARSRRSSNSACITRNSIKS